MPAATTVKRRRRNPVPPEFLELNAIRLAQDWTWQQLSDAMGAIGCRLSINTLIWNLSRAPGLTRNYDRTIHKVRRFLDHIQPKRRSTVRKTA